MAKKQGKRKDVHYMEKAIEAAINECPDGHAVMVFESDGKVTRYAGYRLERSEAIKVVKTWLFQQGKKENWMNHIE